MWIRPGETLDEQSISKRTPATYHILGTSITGSLPPTFIFETYSSLQNVPLHSVCREQSQRSRGRAFRLYLILVEVAIVAASQLPADDLHAVDRKDEHQNDQ